LHNKAYRCEFKLLAVLIRHAAAGGEFVADSLGEAFDGSGA